MNLLLITGSAQSNAAHAGPFENFVLGGILLLAGLALLSVAFLLTRTERA